jgi:hypothetical protein
LNREGLKPNQSAEEAREILNAIRRLKVARLRLLRELSWFVDELPQEERADMLKTVFEVFDGSGMAESANSMSRLFMTLREERPELASELFPDIEAFFRETDFGKVRKAVEVMLDYWAELACKSFDMASDNPVVIANLIGILPPVVNGLVKVLSHSLGKLDMPPEIIASSLFNLMLGLDAGEIGRTITSASKVVNDLHEGNIILGSDEPRFKAVLGEFIEGVLETADAQEVSRAAVALGEDVEAAAGSLTGMLSRDPELLVLCVSTWLSLHNVVVRAAAGVLDELERLPDDALSGIGEEVAEGLDAVEAVRVLNSILALAGRFTEANPELLRRVAADVLGTIDRDRLAAVLLQAYRQAGPVVREDAGIRKVLAAEEVGRRLNDLFVRFNRAGPGAVRDYASRMLAVMDTGELERALRGLAVGLTDAMLASAGKTSAFLKPLMSMVLRIVKAVPHILKKQ